MLTFGKVKAKFHYASWLGAGSELVRSWFEPDSVMNLASNLSATSFEPASVMEFGFYRGNSRVAQMYSILSITVLYR